MSDVVPYPYKMTPGAIKARKYRLKKNGPPKPRNKYDSPYHYQSAEYKKDISLRKEYGITLDERDAMLEAQDNRCGICSGPIKFQNAAKGLTSAAVDHCHETGRVRGILCFGCNTNLGKFNDSVPILEKAIAWLS